MNTLYRAACAAALRTTSAAQALTFPTAAPVDAVTQSLIVSGSTATFAWVHEQGTVWVRVDPVKQSDFICGGALALIQGTVQYSSIQMLSASGGSFCNDLHVTTIFQVQPYSLAASGYDGNVAVRAIYGGAAFDVPAGPVVIPDPTPTASGKPAPTAAAAETRPVVYYAGNLGALKAACKQGAKTVRAVPIVAAAGRPGFACPGLKPGRPMQITIIGTP